MGSDGKYDSQGEGAISLEGRFVEHYFRALDSLQGCWNNESGEFHKERFNLQLLYLIRLLPDKKKQEDILKKWGEIQDLARDIEGLSPNERQSYAGMEVVTELVMFVCDAFELVNVDITGPATSKQYREAAIQVPDMTPVPPEIT